MSCLSTADTHSNSSQLSGRKRKRDMKSVNITSNSSSPLDMYNSFRVSEEEESNEEDEQADLLDM